MPSDNKKELSRIRVENQVEDGTPDLLWCTRFDFDGYAVADHAVNSGPGCIIAEADRAQGTAVREGVPSGISHDELTVCIMICAALFINLWCLVVAKWTLRENL